VIERRHTDDADQVSARVGETFGRYQLLGLLGQGGMGRLYIAERRGIQGFVKIVALKRIQPHLADSKQLREMFLTEARIAARLEHPNIVATYELGEVDGKYFISMEYLPGEDLSAIITGCQDSRMPIDVAAALTQQAAQGLHYAHEARDGQGRPIGLVHRDVSPRNIFVTYHGVVKLLDFGVVRGPERQKSIPGVFKGKYGYCAPEQIEGRAVDRRTDVFCLGIALWECLTGARLFDASTDVATIDAVRSRPIEPPSALRPDVPQELDAITLRALAREPDRRFKNAHDMSEELDRFLVGQDERPTSKSLGRWMETIFGAERASLKKAVSQGGDVEATLDRLLALNAIRPAGGETTGERTGSSGGAQKAQPRALWSTSIGSHPSGDRRGSEPSGGSPSGRSLSGGSSLGRSSSTGRTAFATPSSPARAAAALRAAPEASDAASDAQPSRAGRKSSLPIVLGVALVLGGVGVVAAVALRGERSFSDSPAPGASRATATLEIQSQPPGAHVFVDGSPSGMRTPATLRGLSAGSRVQIRLDKAGYEPVTEQVTLNQGQSRTLSLVLRAAGNLRLVGAPASASVYLDDRQVDGSKPLAAAPGPHKLRVETGDGVLFSKTIDVPAGADIAVDVPQQRSRE
jgi:serine/threonine protein kinase